MARLELFANEHQIEAWVTLSRRNLLVLLDQLDQPAVSRLIISRRCHLNGVFEPTLELVLCGTRDDDDTA